jgi:hypothetical protein
MHPSYGMEAMIPSEKCQSSILSDIFFQKRRFETAAYMRTGLGKDRSGGVRSLNRRFSSVISSPWKKKPDFSCLLSLSVLVSTSRFPSQSHQKQLIQVTSSVQSPFYPVFNHRALTSTTHFTDIPRIFHCEHYRSLSLGSLWRTTREYSIVQTFQSSLHAVLDFLRTPPYFVATLFRPITNQSSP